MNKFLRTRYLVLILTVIGVFIACRDAKPSFESLDLLTYGLPLKIKAPANSQVEMDDLGMVKDMTIIFEDSYSVQIFASEADILDVIRLKNEHKAIILASVYFSKIIEEEDAGFVYEKKIDDSYINYSFRYFKIRGDTKYIFQTGLSGKFTLDQVKAMYRAVQ